MNKIIIIVAALLLSACFAQPTTENITAAGYNVDLGLGYLEKGDNARAKEKLLRASQQAPDLLAVHLALAYYYEQIGQVKAAIQSYQQALKIDSVAGQVNNNYGAFLCRHGDYAESMVYFQQAMNDVYYLQVAKTYENAALCSIKIHDLKAAGQYADLAVQQDPSRADIFLKMSYLLEQQGDKNNAEFYFNRYQQTRPMIESFS